MKELIERLSGDMSTVEEIEKDIKDSIKKKDKLYARMEDDYKKGNMTRSKVTSYNAEISRNNDRIFELRKMLNNIKKLKNNES